jgi:hypothetical protein
MYRKTEYDIHNLLCSLAYQAHPTIHTLVKRQISFQVVIEEALVYLEYSHIRQ